MKAKVRVNFQISSAYYEMVQEIASEEGSSSADVFRNAVVDYVKRYKTTIPERLQKKQIREIDFPKEEIKEF